MRSVNLQVFVLGFIFAVALPPGRALPQILPNLTPIEGADLTCKNFDHNAAVYINREKGRAWYTDTDDEYKMGFEFEIDEWLRADDQDLLLLGRLAYGGAVRRASINYDHDYHTAVLNLGQGEDLEILTLPCRH